MSPSPLPASTPKSGVPVWVFVVLAAGGALVVVVGILAALGIYGVRKYVMNAKASEGRNAVGALIKGVVACAAETGRLPSSSSSVPLNLASVAGRKYSSHASEWANDPTFACAKFSLLDPQYFQYRWVLENSETGYAQAVADFDGDGTPDLTLRIRAHCIDGQCVVDPQIDERR